MRRNEPNTGIELHIESGIELISTTDLKGIITSCNDDFVRVSGFEREELIGTSHNLVRNPDVPSAVFQDMWSTLQNNQPWMGIVKNRCKNGDHYWVDAYATPIIENGQTVGYESVRVAASREQVKSAEKLYAEVNNKKSYKIKENGFSTKLLIAPVIAYLAFAIPFILPVDTAIQVFASLVLLTMALSLTWFASAPIRALAKNAGETVRNPILQKLYTDDMSETGMIKLTRIMEAARIRTILGRTHHVATLINSHASSTSRIASEARDSINKQQLETDTIASAMEEMSMSISGVADNAAQAANNVTQVDQEADTGRIALKNAEDTVRAVDVSVTTASQAMEELGKDADNIGSVITVIQEIAEQTNLLALNAAIEAARAGEQGRGFAVVADEVRSLASRTADSTLEIRQIIESLQSKTKLTIQTMELGREQAHTGVEHTMHVTEVLEGILSRMADIKSMNMVISTSVSEQTTVAHSISANVHSIVDLGQKTSEIANSSLEESVALDQLADELEGLVQRFRS